ncbi:STAS domain-containing protein [Pseudonocardia sp. H11422]|uniref:STAS domain-containing protein n=1 Tax=Pseudonocardia sp. H11422 TaxID=2835866 RepID=UPI001BDC167A|nr:STAS domain-containing protein [Pseudonocardia sp. H11422]
MERRTDDSAAGAGPFLEVRLSQLRAAVPLLQVDGHLAPATAAELFEILDGTLAQHPWGVLDLSALSALHDGVVPDLVGIARRAGDADIGLYLVVADGIVAPTLHDAGVLELFELHPDVHSALRAMS